MATVCIRNLPEKEHRKLRVRAAQNGRSMEAELRAIIGQALRSEPSEDDARPSKASKQDSEPAYDKYADMVDPMPDRPYGPAPVPRPAPVKPVAPKAKPAPVPTPTPAVPTDDFGDLGEFFEPPKPVDDGPDWEEELAARQKARV